MCEQEGHSSDFVESSYLVLLNAPYRVSHHAGTYSPRLLSERLGTGWHTRSPVSMVRIWVYRPASAFHEVANSQLTEELHLQDVDAESVQRIT